jgi:hypothetical protein
LADTLRRWLKERKAMDDAGWSVQDASTYLRGHDDRQPEIDALTAEVEKWKGRYYDVADAVTSESTGVEDLCRQARQTRENCAALTARVRELEAQPAAVGVVGSVRWGLLDNEDEMRAPIWNDRSVAQRCADSHPALGLRVVAIVDPAQIVPLASATPVRWAEPLDEGLLTVWPSKNEYATIPLYPGLAQPAQEREG